MCDWFKIYTFPRSLIQSWASLTMQAYMIQEEPPQAVISMQAVKV